MYNHDVIGTRHNPGETAIGRDNAGRLEEKWRFPAKGLGPGDRGHPCHAHRRGRLRLFRHGHGSDLLQALARWEGALVVPSQSGSRGGRAASESGKGDAKSRNLRFQASPEGIMGSALVTEDTVYFGDVGGWFYALDRATGAERWKLNARAKDFPGAHAINVFMASPILVEGKLIVAGGTLEQLLAGGLFYRGSTGRGFVMALEPKTGRIAWKYDVGPKPEPLNPRSRSRIAGATTFSTSDRGRARSGVPPPTTQSPARSSSARMSTRRPDGRPRTTRGCTRASRARSSRWTSGDGAEKWVTQLNPGDVWTNSMRAYDPKEGPAQGPVDRRHAESLHDRGRGQADPGGRRGLQERRLLRLEGLGREDPGPHPDLYRPADLPALPDAGPPDARPAELHRRSSDRLRDRRLDDLHQRHRCDPAGVAGEAGRQRRAADGRSRGGHQPGHADGALAA